MVYVASEKKSVSQKIHIYTDCRFLHTGPKKGVEKEYKVYFAKNPGQ